MRLRWDPEPADWAVGTRAVLPFARWVPWFAAAFCAFGGALLVLGWTGPGVFGVGAGAVIAALPRIAVLLAFRRDPVAGRTVTAEVDAGTLRMMTYDGTAYSAIPLSELAGWTEARRTFVLRTGGGGFHPVPHRAFDDDGAVDRFRELLLAAAGPDDRS